VLGIFTLDNKWTTELLNFFFSYCGKEEVMDLSKKKEQEANVFHTRFVCVWDVMKTAGKFQRQCAEACLMKVIWMNTTATLNKTFAVRLSIAEDQARCQMR
jgi:hypothetical protein